MKEYSYPADMDNECIPLCNYFNGIGLTTQYSCSGHYIRPFEIIFAPSVTDENISTFLRSFPQYFHTPLLGRLVKWTRMIDRKLESTWSYLVEDIRWAKIDEKLLYEKMAENKQEGKEEPMREA